MAETVNSAFLAQPAGSEDPSLGDDRIRSFKLAWKERLEKEHFLDLAEAGIQPRQGLHRAGSAVSFYQASAPTERNGVALGSSDAGLLWVDSDTGSMYVYSGSAWVSATFFNVITITADTTVSALEKDTLLLFDALGPWSVNLTAGAVDAWTRVQIVGNSLANTILLRSGGTPIDIKDNTVDLIWTGTAWRIEYVRYPIRLLYNTTAGAATFTADADVFATLMLTGGGGGGGGADVTSDGTPCKAGGGDASITLAFKVKLTSGISYAYTVGARGTGGSNTGGRGGKGGQTSFNSGAYAVEGGYGGTGVVSDKDSDGQPNDAFYMKQGFPGMDAPTMPAGTICKYLKPVHGSAIQWNTSTLVFINTITPEGGGSHYVEGYVNTPTLNRGGPGGTSYYGIGGAGVTSADAPGNTGTNPGSGGSGAAEDDTGGQVGGAGAAGAVAIWIGWDF